MITSKQKRRSSGMPQLLEMTVNRAFFNQKERNSNWRKKLTSSDIRN